MSKALLISGGVLLSSLQPENSAAAAVTQQSLTGHGASSIESFRAGTGKLTMIPTFEPGDVTTCYNLLQLVN